VLIEHDDERVCGRLAEWTERWWTEEEWRRGTGPVSNIGYQAKAKGLVEVEKLE